VLAADRVAARYRQLDEEKAAKRIVVVDRVSAINNPGRARSGWGTKPAGPGWSLLSPLSCNVLCDRQAGRLTLQRRPRQLRLSPKRGTTRSGLEWHSLMLRDGMLRLPSKVDRVVRSKSRIPISLPRYPRLSVPWGASQHRGYRDQSNLGYLQLPKLKPHQVSTASAVHPHRPSLERTLRP
jgi:hypothetical protein